MSSTNEIWDSLRSAVEREFAERQRIELLTIDLEASRTARRDALREIVERLGRDGAARVTGLGRRQVAQLIREVQ